MKPAAPKSDAAEKKKWRKILERERKGETDLRHSLHKKGLELVPDLRMQDQVEAVQHWVDGKSTQVC